MFPEEYTPFTLKTDASYDGDPAGDYVLAEHINSLQDAITQVERAIGLSASPELELTERLVRLEQTRPMRVPSVGYFNGELGENAAAIRSVFGNYDLVITGQRPPSLTEALVDLDAAKTPVFGQVDALQSLDLIQVAIGEWKTLGIAGIYLKGFGESTNSTRSSEQDILDSVSQQGLQLILSGINWMRWFNDSPDDAYNPDANPLVIPDGSIIQVGPFAYDGRIYTTSQLTATTLPQLALIRQRNLQVMGFANATTQESYNYVEAAGLLFGLDYLYNGLSNGTSLANRSPIYNWPSYLSQWKTRNPLIFQDGNSLYRDIPHGRIRIHDDLTIAIDGYTLDASMLAWGNNSVPGSALQDASIDPVKLSTYDIRKIVELLNTTTDETLKIDSTKINADDGGAGLPINIPPSNMQQNVIEAINSKNLIGTVSTTKISDAAIESLSASKLTGSLSMQSIQNYVIPAINASATLLNFIDIPYLKADNIDSTGTVSTVNIVTDSLTARAGLFTGALSSVDATVSNYFTGYEGEFYNLDVENLRAKTLTGLDSLHLKTLSADNIGTLVLDAIEANISLGTFDTIVTQALTADTIQANLVTALNSVTGNSITNSALFGDAVIDSASIKNLAVDKLMSGTIDTSVINLSSPDGHLTINDKTIKIYDDADLEEIRRQRVQLGDISEWNTPETPADYGLIVFGPDGSTRLYDHTGVYNAGIKPNAISESKIQDDAITTRVIKAGAVIADHMLAGTITATLIGANQILATHILAGEITADKLKAGTITANEIASGTISAGLIAAGAIQAGHISAHAITADKLAIGFQSNLMQNGFDSFEQIPIGPVGILVSGTSYAQVQKNWRLDGEKSIYLEGTTASNRVRLASRVDDYAIPVMPGSTYVFSTYVRTFSSNDVPISLGIAYEDQTFAYSSGLSVTSANRGTRRSFFFTVPTGINRLSVVVGVQATNVGVYFDCLQVEELTSGQIEAGFWKSTATTVIDGASVKTGYVSADHIHIGGGSVFGNGDIIDITDAGIKARSANGYAMLNSAGLEIHGGAFNLTSNRPDGNSVLINGQQGIAVENPYSLIEIDAVNGFKIISKTRQQIIMDVDPTKEVIRMSGKTLFLPADSEQMEWSMDDKMASIDLTAIHRRQPS